MLRMIITYVETFRGRSTEVSYQNGSGEPLAARFSGWLSAEEVDHYIERAREIDAKLPR